MQQGSQAEHGLIIDQSNLLQTKLYEPIGDSLQKVSAGGQGETWRYKSIPDLFSRGPDLNAGDRMLCKDKSGFNN